MSSLCYLCLNKIKYKNASVCTDCFCKIQDYRNESCARCGQINCASCQNLSSFTTVTSMYLYKDILADLLILAKENNNLKTQNVINELFFIPAKNAIKKIIIENKIDYVILSPLRKERMFNAGWHSNILWDQVLINIQSNKADIMHQFEVLYPYFITNKKKQSFIPSQFRKLKKSITEIDFNNKKINKKAHFLFVDDVLTSGQTAINCQKAMELKQIPIKEWHILTLFRSPQAS